MRPLRIVVSGMVAGDPYQGGATWAVLQYVLGLQRLGYDTLLIEPVDRLTRPVVQSFDLTVADHGLGGSAALVERGSPATHGLDRDTIRRRCRRADVLINVSGLLREPSLVESIPTRVYVDLDPAFTQLWADTEGIDMGFAGHTHFVTVGGLLGTSHCPIPACGLEWIKTVPPVVLARWPVSDRAPNGTFTTVGNWRAYGSIEAGGRHYGQKAHSMRRLLDVPAKSGHGFAVALAIHPDERDDLEALRSYGWRLIDPRSAAGTATAYRRFVQASLAEIGIAKSGYVESRCGWFSDRSACYLASGRPVLAQDTGIGDLLPVGEGLLLFADADQAATAADAVASDYDRHRRAARRLAEEHFDSDRVLGRLLEEVGAA